MRAKAGIPRRGWWSITQVVVVIVMLSGGGAGGVFDGFRETAAANTPIRTHAKSKAKGFDTCQAPSVSTMRDFWEGTPYYYVGVYTGGNLRACSQPNLSESWFDRVDEIGFGFLLIHLGPQAPCTNFRERFSSNPDTARQQGHEVAGWAIDKTIGYGFHVPGDTSKMGPIIYYDLEGYDTSNETCKRAVKNFIAGWTAELHQWRRLSGVYGPAGGTAWGQIWNLNNRPDDVWIAHWNDKTNVYAVSAPTDDKWQYRRFKQYKDEITVSHNGSTLTIDKNCARGQLTGDNGYYGDNTACY